MRVCLWAITITNGVRERPDWLSWGASRGRGLCLVLFYGWCILVGEGCSRCHRGEDGLGNITLGRGSQGFIYHWRRGISTPDFRGASSSSSTYAPLFQNSPRGRWPSPAQDSIIEPNLLSHVPRSFNRAENLSLRSSLEESRSIVLPTRRPFSSRIGSECSFALGDVPLPSPRQ